ncbi:hypothetical protein J4425_01485 [Candidatus Woesearchaeota archaeon]|nr:hypothetical protein [Candidatus Woesearchaeota archaeon]
MLEEYIVSEAMNSRSGLGEGYKFPILKGKILALFLAGTIALTAGIYAVTRETTKLEGYKFREEFFEAPEPVVNYPIYTPVE